MDNQHLSAFQHTDRLSTQTFTKCEMYCSSTSKACGGARPDYQREQGCKLLCHGAVVLVFLSLLFLLSGAKHCMADIFSTHHQASTNTLWRQCVQSCTVRTSNGSMARGGFQTALPCPEKHPLSLIHHYCPQRVNNDARCSFSSATPISATALGWPSCCRGPKTRASGAAFWTVETNVCMSALLHSLCCSSVMCYVLCCMAIPQVGAVELQCMPTNFTLV